MNEEFISNIFDKAAGIPIHKVDIATLGSTEWDRTALCKKCGTKLTSVWIDDEDRLTGWSAWRGEQRCIEDNE